MLKKIACLAVPLIALPLAVNAAVIELPKTGQTACYDTAGNVVECAGTGQDGEKQIGVAWPAPRLVDNGDGTVTDNLTGLVWLKNANCFEMRTWDQALTAANQLQSGDCGLNDSSTPGQWRLPNIGELQSLMDLSNNVASLPSLPAGHPFTSIEASYWSSTTHAIFTPSAWLNKYDGSVLSNPKSGTFYVWPVRNGQLATPEIELPRTGQTACWDTDGNPLLQCAGTGQDGDKRSGVAWPDPRFVDNGNGTITDTLTDLVWLKNADCYGATGWQQALDNARQLANGACGLDDSSASGAWRLPNRTEMLSIINYQANGAVWLASQGFTGGVLGWYWTSDTFASTPATKWIVHSVGDALPDPEAGQDGIHALYVRDLAGPAAALAPGSDDFGNVGVGTSSAPRSYTISNTGAQNLVVGGITLAGTDSAMFTVNPGDGTAGTCGSLTPTLAAGSSCSVAVVFTPTSTGAKTAALTVASNSVGSPTGSIALTGTGITVTFDVAAGVTGENGTVEPSAPVQVADGSTAAFTLAPATGFQADTTVGGTCPAGSFNGNTYTTGSITENCSVSFAFVPLTFTISTAISGDGTITCTPATTVVATTEVSCVATPGVGQQLTGLTVDGVAQTVADPASFTHSFGPVTADHAISASFTPAALTVTFATGSNGSITGNASQSVDYNGNATEVTAVPAPGYHFVNWTSESGFISAANPLIITNVIANQAITANFAADDVVVDPLVDLVRAYQAALGKMQLSEQERARCDVAPLGEDGRPNPNGIVDVGDVVILLRHMAGLVTW